jgi:small-conductance mechanosensitive channel
MNGLFNLKEQLFWMLVVVIGFPLSTIILGEINLRLRRGKQPLFTPLSNLRNLVLPALTLFLVLTKVIGLARDVIGVRLAETLLWIALIYTALSLLNVILFEDAPKGTWQANTPKLFLELSRFFLILIGIALVLSTVWGTDLGALITAFGVGSLVIGLALQNNLSNIFSGMALLFEKPFKLGDWLQVDNLTGKVVEITWRSVHLQTKSGDIIIVPNSKLVEGTLKNFNRPSPIYQIKLELGFSCDDPPNKVKQIITQTALKTEGVLSEPQPLVLTSEYADYTINYQVLLYVTDYGQELKVRDRFMTRVWYVTKRYNLNMPYPITSEFEYQASTPTPEMLARKAKETLITIPSISQFGSDTLDILSREGTWLDFAKGEFVMNEGEPLLGLYLIIEGVAEILVTDKMGQKQVIGHLEQGELFGEKASLISTQISDVCVLAVEDLQVLLLEKNLVQTLLEQSPRLSQEIGEIMELRRRAVSSVLNVA